MNSKAQQTPLAALSQKTVDAGVIRTQDAIKALATSLKQEGDLVGDALHDAAATLCDNWLNAVGDGCQDNLAEDVSALIQRLREFQDLARKVLPIQNGGFGGHPKEQLVSRLSQAGVHIYCTDDALYGYTGCDIDGFDSFDAALNAALLEHSEIVAELTEATP